MKRIFFIIVCLSGFVPSLWSQGVDGVSVNNLKTERNGKYLSVNMLVDLGNLNVETNRAVIITPMLVNGNDSLELKSIGIYGRRRYYHYVRNGESMLSNNELTYKASQKPDNVDYQDIVDYRKWMDGAELRLHRYDYGCCNSIMGEQIAAIGNYVEPKKAPEPIVAEKPKVEITKLDTLSGAAYVDFVVNKTNINPEYRNNPTELHKIQATIDSVRSIANAKIKAVILKGYASPEGSYAHNGELAKARTEALKSHILQLYHFDSVAITTEYEPEDWAGLRKFVTKSNIANRDKILAIIDSDMEPDAREVRIKKEYPAQYKFLLQFCYPSLRHTDYFIVYDIETKIYK